MARALLFYTERTGGAVTPCSAGAHPNPPHSGFYIHTIMADTKRDEHGEYKPDAGSPHPVDPDDVQYEPCNAVLRHTWSRYGERRYCTGMAVSNFGGAANYEHPEFCKHHQSRHALMKHSAERYKTGAYATSHEHVYQHLPTHKKIMANEMYKSLLEASSFNFETEDVTLEIDVEGDDFAPEADVLEMKHPVPTNTDKKVRATALWHAALDFMRIEDMKREQFRVAAEETHEGRQLAVGERQKVVSVTETGQEIRDVDEHHLNLPISRITKDYKEHVRFGGVQHDPNDEEEGASPGERDWVAVVKPDDEMPPEQKEHDSSPLADVEAPDE